MDQAVTPRAQKKKTSRAAPEKGPARVKIPPIRTVDAHDGEARSRQVLAALMAFAGGDFDVRLPVDWSGVDGRIAEAFNQSISNAGRITVEAARVSTTVGKEGRLSQRISAPGAPPSSTTPS